MGIARSTFYDMPDAGADDATVVAQMKAICDEFETYGYRRVGAELRHRGLVVNAKKVRRLMREHALNPRRRRRFIATTDSDHNDPICSNLFPRKQRFAMQNEMSTSGQKQTYAAQSAMSALPPKADMCSATRHVGTAAHAGPDRLVRDEFQPVD